MSYKNCITCGHQVPSGACHCTRCHTYFCYLCGIRVAKNKKQYECENKNCSRYGKILCETCVENIHFKGKETCEDHTGTTLLAGGVIALATVFVAPVAIAAVAGAAGVYGASYIAEKCGANVWGDTSNEKEVSRGWALCCKKCKQPVAHKNRR